MIATLEIGRNTQQSNVLTRYFERQLYASRALIGKFALSYMPTRLNVCSDKPSSAPGLSAAWLTNGEPLPVPKPPDEEPSTGVLPMEMICEFLIPLFWA